MNILKNIVSASFMFERKASDLLQYTRVSLNKSDLMSRTSFSFGTLICVDLTVHGCSNFDIDVTL